MSTETKLRLRSAATVMVILAMIFAFAISGVRIFGLQVYGVLTGSMEPAYPTGSLVYIKKVDPASLRVNDVITFSVGRGVVATHRIVELVPNPDNPYSVSFRTKGDANDHVDNALVQQSNVVGKVVFSLPYLGYVANYIQHPPGTYIAILVSLVLIAFVFMTDNVEEEKKQGGNAAANGKKPLLPASVHEKIDPLIEKYLPFLKKKQQPDDYLQRGYSPQQVQYPQQYQPQTQYPQQYQQPVQYPQQYQQQVQYPQQYQQQVQYPQQYQPQVQYPQQYQPQAQYPQQYQQQVQYPQQYQPQAQYPQQYQQPVQQYPRQPVNPQQGYVRQPRTRQGNGNYPQ